MSDRFIVLASENQGVNPEVYYVSDEKSDNIYNFDPRERGLAERILLDIEIDSKDVPKDPVCRTPWELAAIQAIVGLDAASHAHMPHFRKALTYVFKLGMEAQRELDLKAHASFVDPDEFR